MHVFSNKKDAIEVRHNYHFRYLPVFFKFTTLDIILPLAVMYFSSLSLLYPTKCHFCKRQKFTHGRILFHPSHYLTPGNTIFLKDKSLRTGVYFFTLVIILRQVIPFFAEDKSLRPGAYFFTLDNLFRRRVIRARMYIISP